MQGEDERDLMWMRRVAQGDREALAGLVAAHQARMYRYARGLVRDDAAAEDALQEAFVDVMRGAAGFRGEARVRAWLLRLVRHAAFRQGRLRAGQPRHHEPLEALGDAAGWGHDDPEDQTRRLESAAVLHAALDALDAEDREVLVLRELDTLSGDEVAAMLGISLAAQKSRLHRARLRLSARLREALPDGP